MSNLFKSGFGNLTFKNFEPFVVDVNGRMVRDEQQSKIVRPLDEQEDNAAEAEGTNRVILDDAMDKAKLLRDDAMVKAAKIIADAQAEAEEIREKARREGYEQGLSEGNMEAMKRADAYLERTRREQEELLAQNNRQLALDLSEAEKGMVDVACGLIEKLTGILVDDFKPVMLHMINNALNASETSRNFIIRVSDESYTYVADNKDRIVGAANPSISIEIYGDAKLKRHQCIIETDNGIIDLSMDVQIRNLVTAIKLLSD